MTRYLLVIILICSLFMGVSPCETWSSECQTGELKIIPDKFFCANGNYVTYAFTYKNNNTTLLSAGSATFKVGKDLEIISTTPALEIFENIINFTIPELEPDKTFKLKIKLKVNTNETRMGFPMMAASSVTHQRKSSCISSRRAAVFLWAPTKYPLIEAQLKIVSRNGGRIDLNLIIESGYPSFEYSIYWDDKSESNTGGLVVEGEVELTHTYSKDGEYNVVCRITDSLGRHKIIRKRLYILPWKTCVMKGKYEIF